MNAIQTRPLSAAPGTVEAPEPGERTPLPGHQEVRELAERLRVEYWGAVPPGQVLGAVVRAYRTVLRDRVPASARMTTCEAMARRRLTDLVAGGGRAARAVVLPSPVRA